jgi:MerR family transcriptional regulator, thiopeptide resistance regulator
MYTISQLAKKFKLARSTLLHYDAIGLLRAADRSRAGYRLFSERDVSRLAEICRFRAMGLSLKDVAKILDGRDTKPAGLLAQRLSDIDTEIRRLQDQRQTIVKIMDSPSLKSDHAVLTKEKWIAILRATGLDRDGMRRWHVEFERTAPADHQRFLEALGIPQTQIMVIREGSRP